MNQIVNEMTDPENLLPEDQYLLDVDPESLINTSPDRRQAWLANLDSATAAAEHKKRKWDDTVDSDDDDGDDDDDHDVT